MQQLRGINKVLSMSSSSNYSLISRKTRRVFSRVVSRSPIGRLVSVLAPALGTRTRRVTRRHFTRPRTTWRFHTNTPVELVTFHSVAPEDDGARG